jgi:succinyl-diaminopimelate desuccinylase
MQNTSVDQIDVEEIVVLACRLVEVDTSNPPGNEDAAARILGQYLSDAGIEVEYYPVEEGRTVLLGRLRGRESTGHLVFSGHLDVVPAREPGWTHNPFIPTRKNGRLIGRGAADMKGGIAAMAVALATLRRKGLIPRADVVLAASVGEERGMVGARFMATNGLLRDCGYLVVGEPTNLEICSAQRGVLVFTLTVRGEGTHSSMAGRGVSAISYMARAIVALESHPFPFEASDLLGAPSVNVGVIEGGVAANIVPDRCTARTSIRLVAGQTPEVVEAEVRQVLEDTSREHGLPVECDLTILGGGAALQTDKDHPLLQATFAAMTQALGYEPLVRGFTGGTEAGILCRTFGFPMVICGPGGLEQAHQVDEFVEISQLHQAAKAYFLLAQDLLGDGWLAD